eukprot:SAG31_NODE_20964_length_560_cov_10.360087_1_plen_80_part_10
MDRMLESDMSLIRFLIVASAVISAMLDVMSICTWPCTSPSKSRIGVVMSEGSSMDVIKSARSSPLNWCSCTMPVRVFSCV